METIKSSAEISRLFEEGRRIGTPDVTLIVLRNEQHGRNGRAAFIAGKKLGNAVWRNRAKRRMRALCRETDAVKPGYDMVFLAKKSLNSAPYDRLLANVRHALAKV